MKDETIKHGLELIEKRDRIIRKLDDLPKICEGSNNYTLQFYGSRGVVLSIKSPSITKKVIDLCTAHLIKELAEVKLELEELSDESIPEIPADDAE